MTLVTGMSLKFHLTPAVKALKVKLAETPQVLQTPVTWRMKRPAVPVDAGVEEREVEILARNLKTKIIHECRNDAHVSICDQSSYDEVMIGALTSCGRVMTSSYKLVLGPYDWTAKSRICFKGRRAP